MSDKSDKLEEIMAAARATRECGLLDLYMRGLYAGRLIMVGRYEPARWPEVDAALGQLREMGGGVAA